jgi:type I restriction enzyme M protein
MFMYRTGAAIPNVSDTDLANIQIYIPNNGAIDEISARIREAFELRQKSREQIEQIELEFI